MIGLDGKIKRETNCDDGSDRSFTLSVKCAAVKRCGVVRNMAGLISLPCIGRGLCPGPFYWVCNGGQTQDAVALQIMTLFFGKKPLYPFVVSGGKL